MDSKFVKREINKQLKFYRNEIKNFLFKNSKIEITDPINQINIINIMKNNKVIAIFLEIKDQKIAFYFLLNSSTILTNTYHNWINILVNKTKYQNTNYATNIYNKLNSSDRNTLSPLIVPTLNRFTITAGPTSKSCVQLWINLQNPEAHISFIKKRTNDNCFVKFIKDEKRNIPNLIYISLKLFQAVNYIGPVYLDDNARKLKNPQNKKMRSISLLEICKKILKNNNDIQYSIYNEFDFYLINDINKLISIRQFLSTLTKNNCTSNNSQLNSELERFLVNLVNTDYLYTIQKFEEKYSFY